MTEQTITVVGARGGSGTSTVAAALALLASRRLATELVAADVGTAAALFGLGVTQDPSAPFDVADGLTLVSTATNTAQMSVIDAGRLDQLGNAPTDLLLVVLRGPCYLGLRSIVTSELQPDGIVLLSETGRSLTLRDVADVCGVPVVAQIHVTATVARTVDAGLLIARSHALRELAALHTYIDNIIALTDPATASRNRHPSARSSRPSRTPSSSPATVSPHPNPSPPTAPSKNVTDLPMPLSGIGRAFRASRFRFRTRHSLLRRHCWRERVEHREVESGSDRVLRR